MKEKALEYFESVKKIYADARPNSRRLHTEACKYMPGGDTRTATFFLPFPNFIKYGEGAYMYDEDEQLYITYSWTCPSGNSGSCARTNCKRERVYCAFRETNRTLEALNTAFPEC